MDYLYSKSHDIKVCSTFFFYRCIAIITLDLKGLGNQDIKILKLQDRSGSNRQTLEK